MSAGHFFHWVIYSVSEGWCKKVRCGGGCSVFGESGLGRTTALIYSAVNRLADPRHIVALRLRRYIIFHGSVVRTRIQTCKERHNNSQHASM